MSGSVSTAHGRPSTTSRPRLGLRIGASALCFLILLGLIILVESAAARRLRDLQQNLAALETDAFHLALHVRAGIHELNGTVLRSQLTGETAERQIFETLANALQERLRATLPRLSTPAEQNMARDLEAAFQTYLQATTPLVAVNVRPLKRESISLAFATVTENAAAVLAITDDFAALQHSSLADQFTASYETVGAMRSLMRSTTILLLALLLGVGWLSYRFVVAPLRRQLSASQAAMADQQRLASLGALAAGVAHEIRNPLMAMKLRLFSFGQELPAALSGHEDLRVISGEVDRLERIVQGFLDYARPAEPRMQSLSVAELLHEVATLLRGSLKKQRVEIEVEAPTDVRFTADKEQIKQVLINLIRNAGDSMEAGGTVHLRTRPAMATLGRKPGPVVIFEVADTGKGIPPNVEHQVFEPFYSTKAGGTGLGLAIAARIAERHGGSIQFHSRVDRGTTFTLTLPRIP